MHIAVHGHLSPRRRFGATFWARFPRYPPTEKGVDMSPVGLDERSALIFQPFHVRRYACPQLFDSLCSWISL